MMLYNMTTYISVCLQDKSEFMAVIVKQFYFSIEYGFFIPSFNTFSTKKHTFFEVHAV